MSFTANGDKLTVCDIEADGYAALAYIETTNNTLRYQLQAGGVDTCKTRDASYGGVYDLPEGNTWWITVCLVKGGYTSYCHFSQYGS